MKPQREGPTPLSKGWGLIVCVEANGSVRSSYNRFTHTSTVLGSFCSLPRVVK